LFGNHSNKHRLKVIETKREKREAHTIVVGKPEGKKPVGRPVGL
jgi:hypothetical protein